MKKTTAALAVIVALGAVWTGAAWYTGQKAEDEYQRQTRYFNQMVASRLAPYGLTVQLEPVKFERGLFTSDYVYNLILSSDNDKFSLPFVGKFYHGPLPLNTFSPAMFSTDYALANTPQTKELFDAVPGENPSKGRFSFSYAERMKGSVEAPLIVYHDDDASISIRNFKGEYDTDKNGIGKNDASVDLIKISAGDEEPDKAQYEFAGIEMTTDLTPTKWDYITAGTQRINIQNVKFSAENNGSGETGELKNIEIKTDLTEKDNFVDLNLNFKSAELINSSFSIGSFAADVRAAHLEAGAVNALTNAFLTSNQRQLENAGVKLLQNRPHFMITPLTWANSAGQSRAALDIDLADADLTKVLRGKTTELFNTFDLSVHANKAQLQEFLTQSGQHQGLEKAQAEERAKTQIENFIREGEKDNFVIDGADTITSELKLIDGKLMLNGKEIPEEQIQMALFMFMTDGFR